MQRQYPSYIEAHILKTYGHQYFEAELGSLNRNEISKKALIEVKKIPNTKIEWTKEKIIKWFHNNEEIIKQKSYDRQQMKQVNIPPEWSDPYYINPNMRYHFYPPICPQLEQNDQVDHMRSQSSREPAAISTSAQPIVNVQTHMTQSNLLLRMLIRVKILENRIQELESFIKNLNAENQGLESKIQKMETEPIATISDIPLFVLATTTSGLTYSKASLFLTKLNINHPSERSFYREQNGQINKIIQALDDHLIEIRKRIENNTYISFDGCWNHPRHSRQCLGTFIDNKTGYIIDYFIVFLKMKGHSGNFAGCPQGMESHILRKMAPNWIGDKRIVGICEDSDNKSNKIYSDLNWKIARIIDQNHMRKHFKVVLKKESSLKYLEETLIIWFNTCMQADETKRIIMWEESYYHFCGDHSRCNHDKEIKTTRVNDDDKDTLKNFILNASDLLKKTKTKNENTNWNESFHHLKLYYLNKLISWKISFKLRTALAILHWNIGPCYYLHLCEGLNIYASDGVKNYINGLQKKYVNRKKTRNTPEFRRNANESRKKAKQELKKISDGGYGNDYLSDQIYDHSSNSTLVCDIAQNIEPDGDIPILSENDGMTDEEFLSNSQKILEFTLNDAIQTDESSIIQLNNDDFSNIYPVGIKNYWNTCFVCAVLQMLIRIPELHIFLNEMESEDKLINLLKIPFTNSRKNKLTMNTLLNFNLASLINHHTLGKQEDAAEFLIQLLSYLSKHDLALIESLFTVKIETTVVCCSCKNILTLIEDQLIFDIDIPFGLTPISIEDLLTREFTKPKQNMEDSRMCAECAERNSPIINSQIQSLNEYLIIHLKRFEKCDQKIVKNRRSVIISPLLNFNLPYMFVGCVNHIGTLNEGHYYSIVSNESSYYCINDSKSFKYQNNIEEPSDSSYILLYKKVKFNHE